MQKPAEATEDGEQGQATSESVPVSKLDREQRAQLVEQVLETKDQDISRLLQKIQERKARRASLQHAASESQLHCLMHPCAHVLGLGPPSQCVWACADWNLPVQGEHADAQRGSAL